MQADLKKASSAGQHVTTSEPAMVISELEREKIDWEKPVLTLDVNQVALTEPRYWTAAMQGLAPLEWNYFWNQKLELCVTPETAEEITRGLAGSGCTAYNRFKKSQLFKGRPNNVRLDLSEQDANTLWVGIRQILWPTVSEQALSSNQRSDVSQLYFHTIASGTIANSAFITIDHNYSMKSGTISRELGVTVMTPSEAWEEYRPKYDLCQPTQSETQSLWQDQQTYLARLRQEASQ
jgi:hypothetical protein